MGRVRPAVASLFELTRVVCAHGRYRSLCALQISHPGQVPVGKGDGATPFCAWNFSHTNRWSSIRPVLYLGVLVNNKRPPLCQGPPLPGVLEASRGHGCGSKRCLASPPVSPLCGTRTRWPCSAWCRDTRPRMLSAAPRFWNMCPGPNCPQSQQCPNSFLRG